MECVSPEETQIDRQIEWIQWDISMFYQRKQIDRYSGYNRTTVDVVMNGEHFYILPS